MTRFRPIPAFLLLYLAVCALPARAGEFAPSSIRNLQASVPGAMLGEPATRVNDRGEVIGGSNEAKYWSPSLAGQVIPTLGGAYNGASCLSASGEVAGSSQIAGYGYTDAPLQLYTWTPSGGTRGLGALPEGRFIGPIEINALGDIVGRAHYPGHGYLGYGDVAFLWTEAGGYEELLPPSDAAQIDPADLNDRGQVAGSYSMPNSTGTWTTRAFLREANGEFRTLGFPGETFSAATHVNNRGQVAGVFSPDGGSGNVHAFLWSPEGGMVDAGHLPGGAYLHVNDLSESGSMAGGSDGGAWFWSPGTGMVAIPTLGGSYNAAWALNDFDQVVGWSWTAGDGVSRAFAWSPREGTVGLPDLGGSQSDALDINNHGRIVGYSMPGDVEAYGWYAVPVAWTIPDPSPAGDPIARLAARVRELEAARALPGAKANLLLQALESARSFRDGGKGKQARQALDRFSTHLGQLAKGKVLPAATAAELASLADQAARELEGTKAAGRR